MRRDKELTLEITSQCTLNCAWCSSSATPEGEHLPLSTIFKTLRDMQPFCKTVRFSGGEPLLHPQLREFLVEAKEFMGYRVLLLTNGQDALGVTARDLVDEFVVHLVNDASFRTAIWYQDDHREVSLHVVAVEGNEVNVLGALNFAYGRKIPLHVLALQKQGRGIDCQPSKLITWSGEKGCSERRKVTVLANGAAVTCSAMKRKCDIGQGIPQ